MTYNQLYTVETTTKTFGPENLSYISLAVSIYYSTLVFLLYHILMSDIWSFFVWIILNTFTFLTAYIQCIYSLICFLTMSFLLFIFTQLMCSYSVFSIVFLFLQSVFQILFHYSVSVCIV